MVGRTPSPSRCRREPWCHGTAPHTRDFGVHDHECHVWPLEQGGRFVLVCVEGVFSKPAFFTKRFLIWQLAQGPMLALASASLAAPAGSKHTNAPECSQPAEESHGCSWPSNVHGYALIVKYGAKIEIEESNMGVAVGGQMYSEKDKLTIGSDKSAATSFVDSTEDYDSPAGWRWMSGICKSTGIPFNWTHFETMASNAVPSGDCNGRRVLVVDQGGEYDTTGADANEYSVDDFKCEDGSLPLTDEGSKTLVIFKGAGSVTLTRGDSDAAGCDDLCAEFGPTVLAPFAHVQLDGFVGHVDGRIIARSLGSTGTYEGVSLHGNGFTEDPTCDATKSDEASLEYVPPAEDAEPADPQAPASHPKGFAVDDSAVPTTAAGIPLAPAYVHVDFDASASAPGAVALAVPAAKGGQFSVPPEKTEAGVPLAPAYVHVIFDADTFDSMAGGAAADASAADAEAPAPAADTDAPRWWAAGAVAPAPGADAVPPVPMIAKGAAPPVPVIAAGAAPPVPEIAADAAPSVPAADAPAPAADAVAPAPAAGAEPVLPVTKANAAAPAADEVAPAPAADEAAPEPAADAVAPAPADDAAAALEAPAKADPVYDDPFITALSGTSYFMQGVGAFDYAKVGNVRVQVYMCPFAPCDEKMKANGECLTYISFLAVKTNEHTAVLRGVGKSQLTVDGNPVQEYDSHGLSIMNLRKGLGDPALRTNHNDDRDCRRANGDDACSSKGWSIVTPEMTLTVGVAGPFEQGWLNEEVSDRSFTLEASHVANPEQVQGLLNLDAAVPGLAATTLLPEQTEPTKVMNVAQQGVIFSSVLMSAAGAQCGTASPLNLLPKTTPKEEVAP
mgnify:CR=1 FL=1